MEILLTQLTDTIITTGTTMVSISVTATLHMVTTTTTDTLTVDTVNLFEFYFLNARVFTFYVMQNHASNLSLDQKYNF